MVPSCRKSRAWLALVQFAVLALIAGCGVSSSVTARHSPLARASRLRLLTIDMFSRSSGWAVGEPGVLYHTVDGGQMWRRVTPRQSLKPSTWDVFSFVDKDQAWFAIPTQSTNLDFFSTNDSGLHWIRHQVKLPLAANPGLYIAFITFAHMNGWLEVAPFSGATNPPAYLYRTSDGGGHWTLISSRPSLPFVSYLHFTTADTGWAIASNPAIRILNTNDGGEKWSETIYAKGCTPFSAVWSYPDTIRQPLLPLPAGTIVPILCNNNAPLRLLIDTSNASRWVGRVVRPAVPGIFAFSSPLDGWLWSVSVAQSLPTWLGNATHSSALWRTEDGGITWQKLLPQDIAIKSLDGGKLVTYLDFSNGLDGWAIVATSQDLRRSLNDPGLLAGSLLIRTTDGGRSWRLVHLGVSEP